MRKLTTIPLVILVLACGPKPEIKSTDEPIEEVKEPQAEISAEPKITPGAELRTTIQWAIGLLEEKKYTKIIEGFMHPDDMAKAVKAEGSVDALSRTFGTSGKPQSLLEMLRIIVDMEPEMMDEGNVAVFRLPEGAGAHEDVIGFEKLGGKWYIRN